MATVTEENPPPKPWEKNGNRTNTNSGSIVESLPQGQASVQENTTETPDVTSSYQNKTQNSQMQPQNSGYNNSLNYGNSGIPNNGTYGNSNYNAGYNSNSAYGGGNVSGYGNRMGYGGMGMMNGYGGGMYGNSMYGGGGGGGMYGGGMMSPYGSMGTPMSNFGMMLGSMQHATSSLGQIGELMGMNADALQHAFHMIFGFFERVGFGAFELMNFATGRVDLSMYEQNPVIDPRNGQPLPPPTVEQVQKQRKEKLIRWTMGVIILALGYKIARYFIIRAFKKNLTQAERFNKRWSKVTGITEDPQHSGGTLSEALGIYPPAANPMMNQMNPYGSMPSMYGNGMNSYGANMYGGSPYSSMSGVNMYNRGGMYGNTYGAGYGGSYDNIF